MAAARAGAQRRARPRRHRTTAAEEQVGHSGTGTVGASRRPRLRRLRHSASACAPERRGLRAVPLAEGDAGLRLCPVSVCLSNRLGLAAPASPVGEEALCAGMLGDWPAGRVPTTRWSCTRPSVVSNPPSRPASLPNRWTRASHICRPGPPGPSSQAKLAQTPGCAGAFLQGCPTKAIPTPSGTGNKSQREPTLSSSTW